MCGPEAAGLFGHLSAFVYFFGLALLLLMFLLPGGFVNGFRRLRARVITIAPDPPWLDEVEPLPAEGAGAVAMSRVSGAAPGNGLTDIRRAIATPS